MTRVEIQELTLKKRIKSLSIAKELFMKNGFDNTRLSEIITKSEMEREAFMSMFISKQKMYDELFKCHEFFAVKALIDQRKIYWEDVASVVCSYIQKDTYNIDQELIFTSLLFSLHMHCESVGDDEFCDMLSDANDVYNRIKNNRFVLSNFNKNTHSELSVQYISQQLLHIHEAFKACMIEVRDVA